MVWLSTWRFISSSSWPSSEKKWIEKSLSRKKWPTGQLRMFRVIWMISLPLNLTRSLFNFNTYPKPDPTTSKILPIMTSLFSNKSWTNSMKTSRKLNPWNGKTSGKCNLWKNRTRNSKTPSSSSAAISNPSLISFRILLTKKSNDKVWEMKSKINQYDQMNKEKSYKV